MNAPAHDQVEPNKDFALLILRMAGFLLAFTFGLQKLGWYVTALHSGKSLSTIGLAPLIAHVGFPFPVILALWITFNESIAAFLVGCGYLTRIAAGSLALGMIGALYTSVRLAEDWLRAALYLIAFVALAFMGPGKFSIEQLVRSRRRRLLASRSIGLDQPSGDHGSPPHQH